MAEQLMFCETCATETLFEVPPCLDGHDDCPELMCTVCGTAILLAPVIVWSFTHPRGATVAPRQRRWAA